MSNYQTRLDRIEAAIAPPRFAVVFAECGQDAAEAKRAYCEAHG